MNNFESWGIKDHTVEYYDDIHIYLVDGLVVPSITQIIHKLPEFRNMYKNVSHETLKRAADKGTAMHLAIQEYCEWLKESDIPELQGFKTLKKVYKFDVLENEKPLLLFDSEGQPLACGRMDLLIKIDDKLEEGQEYPTQSLAIADLKRMSSLNKEYLTWQLNLYRTAYEQDTGKKVKKLFGIRLKNEEYQMVPIKKVNIDLDYIKELIKGDN